MMNFRVEDYEAGTVIDEFRTLDEARAFCARCEEEDKNDGVYQPGFYAIRDYEKDEVTRYNY